MGCCYSSEAEVRNDSAGAGGGGGGSGSRTAKVIFPDGNLKEFMPPVKAFYVLQQDPTLFICDSDAMNFDGFVSAVSADEDLRPGQLYFALPLSWLSHQVKPMEMAQLAAKASSALKKSGHAGILWSAPAAGGGSKVAADPAAIDNGVRPYRSGPSGGATVSDADSRHRRRSSSGRTRFTPSLGSIDEFSGCGID